MLRKSSDKIALCYHRAAECRERELQLHDPALKKIMRESEHRWLALARSYELAESIDDFNKEMRRFRKRRGVSSER
jgi:tryptophan 2,3-dioxygenase